ncbi:unnamed protein product [Meloidogyne enterolobii]|uniref:Uncharacterized protein n=1 Tax=Meloidogyne enterolobii TaxID=390850 RepID=A0ACB0ZLS0_MELEN
MANDSIILFINFLYFYFQGGGTLELRLGGADISVNNENVLEYIFLLRIALLYEIKLALMQCVAVSLTYYQLMH